jgi:hypothetical protein
MDVSDIGVAKIKNSRYRGASSPLVDDPSILSWTGDLLLVAICELGLDVSGDFDELTSTVWGE